MKKLNLSVILSLSLVLVICFSVNAYAQTPFIPSWIKNNAKWWSEGQISDSDFTNAIQYLLQKEIIHMPKMAVQPVAYHQIPPWVKNYAGSWANGTASDYNFYDGMQYLIQADIIHANATQQSNQKTFNPSIQTTCNVINDTLPDPKCTPGATDPAVTQANIDSTICVSGYTTTVRPPTSVTNPIKLQVMQDYGFTDSPSNYELDHLIPLELGGAPADVKNLWPESYNTNPNSYDKDGFENYLHTQVCSGMIDLQTAQNEISTNWVKYWDEVHSSTSQVTPTQTIPNASSQSTPTYQNTNPTQSSGTLHIDLQGQNTISRGSVQSMTVTVTDGTNPVSDVSVSVIVIYASGATTKDFSGMTDSSGQYSFSWRIGGNSTPGIFEVDVDASKAGYTLDHQIFSFNVVPAN